MSVTVPMSALPNAKALRVRAALIYLAGCLLSVLWALSGEWFMENELGADVRLGSTSEQSVYVTLRNEANFAWNDVRVSADGQYFYRIGSLAPDAQIDARISDFEYVYRLPRPTGLFYWERVGESREAERAPATYAPAEIVIETREGRVEVPVSL